METGEVPDADLGLDRLAIQDVLARHSRGVDRADEATLAACYWPDATVASDEKTLALYRFDGKSSDVLVDHSGQGRHGKRTQTDAVESGRKSF